MLLIYTLEVQVVSEVLWLAVVDDDELAVTMTDDYEEAVDDEKVVDADEQMLRDNDALEERGRHILVVEVEDILEFDEMLMLGLVVENDESDLLAIYREHLMYIRLDDDEIRIVQHLWLDELELELDELDNTEFDVMLQTAVLDDEVVDTTVVAVREAEDVEYLY